MRSAAFLLLLPLLLLLVWPAMPAQAGEWVEGDGFRLRLPPEFVDVAKSKGVGQAEIDQALELLGSASVPGVDFDMKIFVRQRGAKPDALLFAMAMHVERDLQQPLGELTLDALEAGMREAQAQMEAQGALVEISRMRRILVSAGRPALELEINVDEPEMGPLNCMRALFVVERGTFCVLGLQSMRKNSAEDGILWRAIVTSFRFEERNSLLGLLMRYGPFVLGGLVLLIALIFLKKSSSPKQLVRPVLSSSSGDGESGFSRALDGLPIYGQAPGDPVAPPTEGAGAAPAPTPVVATPPVPVGNGALRAPTIPRAAPPAEPPGDPGGDFAPLPDRSPPANEPSPAPSGGPSGLPRKLPPAQPAPVPPVPAATGASPLPSPAVAERIEIEDLPAPSHMPTNVAMRDAQAPVPQADSADQVLSRLMGFEGDADAEEPGTQPDEPGEKKPQGARIQRNSDFLA